MSEEEKPKNKIVFVTLKMPDGKEHEIPLPPKVLNVNYLMFLNSVILK